ncbi:MAG: glycosyltransferase family 4 protein [Chloroflexi bacterium]|nr:glycosyltransferase family 4 protein [Chloroflexota bacterium]
MHIAFNGWFWGRPMTGSGQYLRRLLGALRRTAPDLQMTLVLPPGVNQADDLPADVSLITTTGRGGRLGKVIFEQRTFPQMVARCGADVAHVPYWGPPLTSPAPLVTTVLDVIPLLLPDYAAGPGARLYTSLVSAAARGSAQVITISDAAKADIVAQLNIPADSITTTHLAADEVYHPRMGAEHDEAVRAKYDLPDEFVLYLGGFDLRKRVNQLLLAYTYVGQAEGDNIPLVLAGAEPAWDARLFPDLRKYAAELDISEYVRWIGPVDEADKPALYRLARVFVFPSMAEGFGLPVIEALASGTPVVANEIPVMDEIAADGAYLVADGNARAMAGAIIALLLQEPLRQTQIQRGLARATHFHWRKTAQRTLEVYEQVLRAAR